VIAIGTFGTRTWTAADGTKRSTLEILAEEIRPSLRWATTQVTKTNS
jgi:single-strand DNA-binding protein